MNFWVNDGKQNTTKNTEKYAEKQLAAVVDSKRLE